MCACFAFDALAWRGCECGIVRKTALVDRVAQWIAHLTSNQGVVGSSPIAVVAYNRASLGGGEHLFVAEMG